MKAIIRPILAAAVLSAGLASPSLATAQTAGPCQYVLGFKTLHDMAPNDIGDCTDNQGFAPNGDAQQHTAKGLMAWRKADNWTAFTNGYMTWLNGPQGLVTRLNTDHFPWEAVTPGATSAGPGAALYSDALTDPNAGQLSKSSGSNDVVLGYRSDGYQIKSAKADMGYHVNVPGRVKDTNVAVDAVVVGAVDHRWVAVGCRLQPDGNSGYELYIYPGSGSFGLMRHDGDKGALLVRDTSKDIKGGGSTNHAELTCAGSSITGTVNGALIAAVNDSTYSEGRSSIAAGADGSGNTVDSRFTNLVVTQR